MGKIHHVELETHHFDWAIFHSELLVITGEQEVASKETVTLSGLII